MERIDQDGLYRFGNDAKEYVNFTNDTNDYELIVFWDGKPASKIRSSLVKVEATEFVSSVTNQDIFIPGRKPENFR